MLGSSMIAFLVWIVHVCLLLAKSIIMLLEGALIRQAEETQRPFGSIV